MERKKGHSSGGGIPGIFPKRREEPELPSGYNWWKAKEDFCPRNLLAPIQAISKTGTIETKHSLIERYRKHPGGLVQNRGRDLDQNQAGGLVFCHRGLYERASTIIENSTGALENGTNQGYHLHELDAFIWDKLDEAFVGHDQVADRVTAKTGKWQDYTYEDILKTLLVSRGVSDAFIDFLPETEGESKTKPPAPAFSSAFETARDRVLGVLDAFWHDALKGSGRTVQLDLREFDLAKVIPHYCFHISKVPELRVGAKPHGAHETLIYKMFESTMWKGYNIHWSCFKDLEKAIIEESKKQYGAEYYERRHLLLCPPIIMVFFADELVELAKDKAPHDGPNGSRKSYRHIRKVAMESISSFVGIDVGVVVGSARPQVQTRRYATYNFILEIGYSGLGLGYNISTNTATDPLTGCPIKDPDVVFHSLVDRALIDVAVELRTKYPGVLLASCTRMPDVITPKGNFKASFTTAQLGPWQQGEKGIAPKLRAIHGGLYPQSDLVVADNPAAEIAARIWIDKKLRLDRRKLVNGPPYYKWLEEGGNGGRNEHVEILRGLNTKFPANTVGKSRGGVPVTIQLSEKDNAAIHSWEKAGAISPSHGRTAELSARRQERDSHVDEVEEEISPLGITSLLGARGFVKSDPAEAKRAFSRLFKEAGDAALKRRVRIRTAGEIFIFSTLPVARRHFANLQIYEAALEGHKAVIQTLLGEYKEADINVWAGLHGTALGAACYKGDISIVKWLLENGAQANPNVSPTPLGVACVKGDSNLVKLLLQFGANPDGSGKDTKTALWVASSYGHMLIVKMLLQYRMNHNIGMSTGMTPLGAACAGGHTKTVDTLMAHLREACDSSTYTKHLSIALQHACAGVPLGDFSRGRFVEEGRYALIAKILYQKPEIVNLYKTPPHGTALMAACDSGHLPAVELLLKRGARIQISNSEAGDTGAGDPRRMHTNERTHTIGATGSLATGVTSGRTTTDTPPNPLHVVIREGSYKPMAKPSTISHPTLGSLSALVVACKNGHLPVVQLLLKSGGDPNFRPDTGFITALEAGCGRSDGLPIAQALITAGADVNLGGPLYIACVTRNEEIVDLLLRHGARANFSIASKDFATPKIISRLALSRNTGNQQYDLEKQLARKAISRSGAMNTDYSRMALPYHMKETNPYLKRMTPRVITKKRPSDRKIVPMNEPGMIQDSQDRLKYDQPVPNCGCLICLLDARLEASSEAKYSSHHNPVTSTLNGMDLRKN